MTSTGGSLERDVSAALRERSITRLKEAFTDYVRTASTEPTWDSRDEMVNMTPFIDCARRIGVDPATALRPIAAGGADRVRDLFDMFVARTDVTLEAFGWSIAQTPSGPVYEWLSYAELQRVRRLANQAADAKGT